MIIFLLLAETILLSAHAFVYFSLTRVFPALSSAQRTALFGSLLFLSFSFIVASILVHVFEHQTVHLLYLIAGWWLGFLTNLILALLALWMIVLIGRVVHLGVPLPAAGILAILLAVFVSAHGAWNAFHPQVKEVTVEIKDLPEEWQGKRVVQLSDIHLGSIYRADFLQSVVNQVNAAEPEAVFITGDLFDGMDGMLDDLVLPLRSLRPSRGTYFITGNHETYLGVKESLDALQGTGVQILDDEMADLGGIVAIGMSYPEQGTIESTREKFFALQPQSTGRPIILLYHAPIYVEEFARAGVSLQLSGHTHRGQQYPFNLITSFMYKGFDYGLHTIGDYSIYTTNGVGTWGPAMRVGNAPEIVVITLENK